MSEKVLIIGKSGGGKSTSLRNLDPKTSVLIQTLPKRLPFRGWKDKWIPWTKENAAGNLVVTDGWDKMSACLVGADKRKEITCVVIDDFQYLMGNEFMRRASEVGFAKFTEIGQNAWNVIIDAGLLRDDLTVVFMAHEEVTELGQIKMKTIGRMLDEKITLEGMFTTVLRAMEKDGRYGFLTKSDGNDIVKAPIGMFADPFIDNDLNIVLEAVRGYN